MLYAQGAGYWHTSGERILDANNHQVRIAGISWYGFETSSQTIGGLYAEDYGTILRTVKAQGFNTVRLPFSSEMMDTPSTLLNIQFSNGRGPINTDLRGLNALQVLDRIIGAAGRTGLKVILDHHRSEAGSSAEANGLWYTPKHPEALWIADWVQLADRYLNNPTVIGFDLHNEPHATNEGGACWDCGGARDWHLAAQRAGDAVLAVNPRLLIFVEGVDVYQGDSYWWGGNLEGVLKSPVVLSHPHQLVYSAHDYGPHEAPQAWFNPATTYTSLAQVWDRHWGFISRSHLAPVWISEFGTTNDALDIRNDYPGSQGQWFASLVHYFDVNRSLGWSYWALNGEDAYGLLDPGDGPSPVNPHKQEMLASIGLSLDPPPFVSPSPARLAPSPVSPVSNGLKWVLLAGSGATFALVFGVRPSRNAGLVQGSDPHSSALRMPNPGRRRTDTSAEALWRMMSLPVPPSPRNLSALSVSNSQIDLSWTPSAGEGVTYNVYAGTSRTDVTIPAGIGVVSPSYRLERLDPGSTYYFVVRAVVHSIASASSEMASATTHPALGERAAAVLITECIGAQPTVPSASR